MRCFFFFLKDTATTEIYTLSLHDALPIWGNTGQRDTIDSRSSRHSCPSHFVLARKPRCTEKARSRQPHKDRSLRPVSCSSEQARKPHCTETAKIQLHCTRRRRRLEMLEPASCSSARGHTCLRYMVCNRTTRRFRWSPHTCPQRSRYSCPGMNSR